MGGRVTTWVEGPRGEWLDGGTAGSGDGARGDLRLPLQQVGRPHKGQAACAGFDLEVSDNMNTALQQRRLYQIATQVYEEELEALETELPVPTPQVHNDSRDVTRKIKWEEGLGRGESDDEPEEMTDHSETSPLAPYNANELREAQWKSMGCNRPIKWETLVRGGRSVTGKLITWNETCAVPQQRPAPANPKRNRKDQRKKSLVLNGGQHNRVVKEGAQSLL